MNSLPRSGPSSGDRLEERGIVGRINRRGADLAIGRCRSAPAQNAARAGQHDDAHRRIILACSMPFETL